MNFDTAVIPLYAMKHTESSIDYDTLPRFVGSGFYINSSGAIATCSHIVKSLKPDETLVVIAPYSVSFNPAEITDIKCHPKYDFAVGYTNIKTPEIIPIHHGERIYLGDDLVSFGYISAGVENGQVVINPMLFKGHVARIQRGQSKLSFAKSTLEVSFASLNGFSGAPIFSNSYYSTESPSHTNYYVAGMLYGNSESSIQVHSATEIDDDGSKYTEEVRKVVELGLAHTAHDIRSFLLDLGVADVYLDHPA